LKVSVEVWQSLPTTSGISLSIPPGWTADSSLDSTQLSSPELNALQNTATAEVPPYEIDIRSLPNPGRATLNEVASSFEDSWFETYASKTFETVNGHAAIRYSDVGAPVPHKTIIGLFVDAGDRVLLITALPVRGDAAAEAVLAQILATLRLQ
jgi:hypothetical protein